MLSWIYECPFLPFRYALDEGKESSIVYDKQLEQAATMLEYLRTDLINAEDFSNTEHYLLELLKVSEATLTDILASKAELDALKRSTSLRRYRGQAVSLRQADYLLPGIVVLSLHLCLEDNEFTADELGLTAEEVTAIMGSSISEIAARLIEELDDTEGM